LPAFALSKSGEGINILPNLLRDMAKSFTAAGLGLNREGFASFSKEPLSAAPPLTRSSHRSSDGSSTSTRQTNGRTAALVTREDAKLLDFYLLEKNAEILVINPAGNGNNSYVRDCSKCGCRQKVPGCKRCGGNRFGVFRICGTMHGMFCEKCSLGVDRWNCPSCHHGNICDQTVKLLTKDRRPAQPSGKNYAPGQPGAGIWSYFLVLLLLIFLISQTLPHD
jgi:hypothetical protein